MDAGKRCLPSRARGEVAIVLSFHFSAYREMQHLDE